MRKGNSKRSASPQRSRSLPLTQRIALEQPPVGFEQQFAFVEGLNSKAERKKTRSWVTTQHYRRKRYEERTAEEGAGSKSKGKSRRRSTSSSSRSDDDQSQPAEASPPFLQRLGSGRADPFNSYPIQATRDVHELVDHFYFVIPSLVHKYWQRAARRPQACWDLFNLYRQHEIPFVGMLHHAAHHLAGMRGQRESLQVIQFKQKSLTAVNRQLQTLRGSCDDWTIIGIGLLANAERVWGDREIARMHWGALKRLLLERGGFPALRHNPAMHTKLVWSFIALSWPTADGNPAYVDGFTEAAAATPGSPMKHHDLHGAFHRSCEEFIRLFNTRRSQGIKNIPSTPTQQREFRRHRHRTTMFREGSELAMALQAIETGYANPDKRRAVDNCRMACLIHLNLVMAENGDFSQATEDFLRSLQRILDQDDDDSSLSAEHLLWTLLAAFKPQDNYERIWKMARLVGVVKRTQTHTWAAIENALRMFLRLPESVSDLEAAVSGWSRDEFLAEVTRTEVTEDNMRCTEGCQICMLKPASF